MRPLGLGLGLPRRLSALDNAFLAVETPAAPMHFSCLAVYEVEAALGDRPTHLVTEIMRRAVGDVPALRRTLLPSLPRVNRAYWGPPGDIDVADHIRVVRLRGTRDQTDLLATAAHLHARRLPRNRPLWDITVIRDPAWGGGRPASRERFGVLFRVHHAAVDGVSGMALFAALHARHATEIEALGPPVGRAAPSLARRLQDTLVDNLDALTGPLRATVHLGRDLRARREVDTDRPPFTLPWTQLNQRVAADRVVVSVVLPRADVTAVRRAVPGTTVNDVMLATVGGALRMLLKGTAPRDLVAGVPVARFRRGAVAEPGNDFDLLRIPLGVDEAAPVRRLVAIQRASGLSKDAHRRGAVELNDAAALVPGWMLDAVVRASPLASRLGVPMPVVSTIVSNVPGPRFPLYLGPAELVDLQALGPIANGLGVFHVITSYRDTVSVTVTTSSSVLPDAPAYAELLRTSFDQLSAAAGLSSGSVAT